MRRDGEPVEASSAEHVQEDPADVIRVLLENRRKFLGFVQRQVESKETAEDILQEALARGIHRIESVRNDELVVAWFYRALRNAVRDHYRRHKATCRGLEALALEVEITQAWNHEPSVGSCQCVGRLISELKPEYAEALQRIEVEGMPVKEFAEQRGLSSGNAGVRVFRAREALRRAVMNSCGACATTGCRNCTCGETQRLPKNGGGPKASHHS
jgi:RNA polymerase sigma-70 factor (ECF subfamily)